MNRINALKEVKEKLEEISEYLQETDQKHPMQVADPYWDTACFDVLINSADETLEWIDKELVEAIKEDAFQENEALPDDGIRTGALVGE